MDGAAALAAKDEAMNYTVAKRNRALAIAHAKGQHQSRKREDCVGCRNQHIAGAVKF